MCIRDRPGHLYRNCPYPPQEGPQPPPTGQPNPNSTRMTAGDQPPRQREPQPRRQEASEASNTRGTYNDTGPRATSSGKQLSFPGKDLATYLKAGVNGRDQECLLDSGSEVSVIPASLVRKSDIRQTDQSLKAVNGTGIKILNVQRMFFNK